MLARLPVRAGHTDATAGGANFHLAYRASFVLPHRRAAWLRYAERLEEPAIFAAKLHPPAAEHVTAAVSDPLSGTASDLLTHLEEVMPLPPSGA